MPDNQQRKRAAGVDGKISAPAGDAPSTGRRGSHPRADAPDAGRAARKQKSLRRYPTPIEQGGPEDTL